MLSQSKGQFYTSSPNVIVCNANVNSNLWSLSSFVDEPPKYRRRTWNVVTESNSQESHKGEVETVEVSPPVLDVPKDDGRENHEDDEAGKQICENLTAKYRKMFQISTALGYLSCDLWKLKRKMWRIFKE